MQQGWAFGLGAIRYATGRPGSTGWLCVRKGPTLPRRPPAGHRSNPFRSQRRAPAAARGRGDLALKPRGVKATERCGGGNPQPRPEPPAPLPAPTASPRTPPHRAPGTPSEGHAGPGPPRAALGAVRSGAARRVGPLGRTSSQPRGAPAARCPLSLFGAPFRPCCRCPPVPTLPSPLCLWLLPFPGLSCFCTDPRGDKLLKYLRRCPCGANAGFFGGRSPSSLGHRSPSVRGWAGGRGDPGGAGCKTWHRGAGWHLGMQGMDFGDAVVPDGRAVPLALPPTPAWRDAAAGLRAQLFPQHQAPLCPSAAQGLNGDRGGLVAVPRRAVVNGERFSSSSSSWAERVVGR